MFAWPDGLPGGLLQAATFRVVDLTSGDFLGTAFLVAPDKLLTCHHVVGGRLCVAVVDRHGERMAAEPMHLDDLLLAASDLAILHLATSLPVTPVPVSFRSPGRRFDSRVQLYGKVFGEAVPITGELLDPARINYGEAGLPYDVEAHAVHGARIEKGMSGAASWDGDAGAVLGVVGVAAGAAHVNFGGFVIPLASASGSPALQGLVAANQDMVARFGDQPNELALRALLTSANIHTVRRLKAREIIPETDPVPREGWAETFERFVASTLPDLCVVSAAGQGKTNLMAQVSLRGEGPLLWLVRAADFSKTESSNRALARLFEEAGGPDAVTWRGISEAFGQSPILLIDGLNEAPFEPRVIAQELLPDLRTWAATNGWRMIFTVRRELFQRIRQRSDDGVFELGRYTAKEAKAVAAMYGLTRRRLEREPLILRFQAELADTSASRALVLDRVVSNLVGQVIDRGLGGHPSAVLDVLMGLAERAEAGEGVVGYGEPLTNDKALLQGLREVNLLETVPAGYKFVFDEIAEFLRARALAADLVADTDALVGHSVNIRALAIETLALFDTETAVQVADRVADTVGSPDLDAFRVIAALSLDAGFDAVKTRTAVIAADDQRLRAIAAHEPGLLTAFPLEAVRRLAYEAVLDESGYGWREKDIWSDLHRATTVNIARLSHGITRLISELIDDDVIDGTELLLGWLDDQTRLAKHGRRNEDIEGTVGSFALCMLFAFRDRIGLDRLFTEVIWKQRPGHSSLANALAAEDLEAMTRWLESLEPETVARRGDWARQVWADVLDRWKEAGHDAGPRVAAAVGPLLSIADGPSFGVLLRFAVSARLPIPHLVDHFRRAFEAGMLPAEILASATVSGLADVEELIDRIDPSQRSTYLWGMIADWSPGRAGPDLAMLVRLVRQTPNWAELVTSDKFYLESAIYRIRFQDARHAGLDALISTLIEREAEARWAEFLIVPAFSGSHEGDAAFARWLAGEIAPKLSSADLRDVFRRAWMSSGNFERSRDLLLGFAKRVIARDLLLALHTSHQAEAPAVEAVLEVFFNHQRDVDDPDIASLRIIRDQLASDGSLPRLDFRQFVELSRRD